MLYIRQVEYPSETNKLLLAMNLGFMLTIQKTTDQSSEYSLKGEAKPKRSHQSRSKIKVMLTVFFDYRGVVHYKFLPTGQIVNKEYYLSVMRHLREAIRKKRPELWTNNSWILQKSRRIRGVWEGDLSW